jgi:hypothetical protein
VSALEAAYDELRRMAHGHLRRLPPGRTLTTRSLVHDARWQRTSPPNDRRPPGPRAFHVRFQDLLP